MSDAWRYATNLDDPRAVRLLLQAALTAHQTIAFAQRQVNPGDFATVPDWQRVRGDLQNPRAGGKWGTHGNNATRADAFAAPSPTGRTPGTLPRPGWRSCMKGRTKGHGDGSGRRPYCRAGFGQNLSEAREVGPREPINDWMLNLALRRWLHEVPDR